MLIVCKKMICLVIIILLTVIQLVVDVFYLQPDGCFCTDWSCTGLFAADDIFQASTTSFQINTSLNDWHSALVVIRLEIVLVRKVKARGYIWYAQNSCPRSPK